ncbi:MAG: hypothetical protein PHD56_06520 [Anaerostipes sp.]|nr:hypothetical protein [Anaerostipes sp.]
MCRNAHAVNAEPVWLSKNRRYEKPYIVTGNIKLAGSEQKPKAVMKR